MVWVVILAGGSGTRFWPLSSPSRPKQLLHLAGPVPSAVAALEAVAPLAAADRILVVAGPALAGQLGDAMGLPAPRFLIEPLPASTGPALTWAADVVRRQDPDGVILSMHADWHLGDPEAFRRAAATALDAARTHDALVTVGIVPARVETGYGYVVPGEALGPGVHRVAEFKEKPDAAAAERLIAAGGLWNSGLFAWTASRFLAEVATHGRELAPALPRLTAGDVAGFFAQVTPVAVDHAVLERSSRVLVVRGAFPWDDIGSWNALARVHPADPRGNVTRGSAHLVDTEDCIVWSDTTPVVLSGVRNLVVVQANGRVLIMDRSRAADLKRILEALPPEVRDLT